MRLGLIACLMPLLLASGARGAVVQRVNPGLAIA